MRIVHGRVSKTNLPDYAEEARERKIQEKKNNYQNAVEFRLSGYQFGDSFDNSLFSKLILFVIQVIAHSV